MIEFEQAQLVEIDPEGFVVHDVEAAAQLVAVLSGDLPTVLQAVVPGRQGGVDDKIGPFQCHPAVEGFFQVELKAELLGVALAQRESASRRCG